MEGETLCIAAGHTPAGLGIPQVLPQDGARLRGRSRGTRQVCHLLLSLAKLYGFFKLDLFHQHADQRGEVNGTLPSLKLGKR